VADTVERKRGWAEGTEISQNRMESQHGKDNDGPQIVRARLDLDIRVLPPWPAKPASLSGSARQGRAAWLCRLVNRDRRKTGAKLSCSPGIGS
jgi:hypothetical protein